MPGGPLHVSAQTSDHLQPPQLCLPSQLGPGELAGVEAEETSGGGGGGCLASPVVAGGGRWEEAPRHSTLSQ